MSDKLFFSQDIIDAWSDEGKVNFENNILTINQDPPTKYGLIPAYRIIKLEGGGKDPNGWLNKIKTKEELEKMGADIYMTSVIVGEVAYAAEYGYIAKVEKKKPKTDEQSDEALLTNFLLKNL